MNYIIYSIILLFVILIIIYILSINNNIDKLLNKIKDTFKVIASKKTNYINDNDTSILLKYLKSHFLQYSNIMISKKIFYIKELDSTYLLKNIEMIGYQLVNNTTIFSEKKHTLTIKFIPIKNELFIGQNSLFGINGNFYIVEENDKKLEDKIEDKKEDKNLEDKIEDKTIDRYLFDKISGKDHILIKGKELANNINSNINCNIENDNNILNLIPDIIHLSSEDDTSSDKDSILITTMSTI